MNRLVINPQQTLAEADIIYSAQEVSMAIDQLASDITNSLADAQPLVMCVMGGAVVFSGQLIPKLTFPLEFDYVQASRYGHKMTGQEVVWKVEPGSNVKDRTVLLLDDILDEGVTLAAIKEKCVAQGATKVLIAVLVEKKLRKNKPIAADFVGLEVPERYVFGCGMDVYGWWRNLPAIYAVKLDET